MSLKYWYFHHWKRWRQIKTEREKMLSFRDDGETQWIRKKLFSSGDIGETVFSDRRFVLLLKDSGGTYPVTWTKRFDVVSRIALINCEAISILGVAVQKIQFIVHWRRIACCCWTFILWSKDERKISIKKGKETFFSLVGNVFMQLQENGCCWRAVHARKK